MRSEEAAPEHGVLGAPEVGDTVRIELKAGDVLVGDVDACHRNEEGEIVSHGFTFARGSGRRADVWDIAAQYDPRDGWSPAEVSKRDYTGHETEWETVGEAEVVTVINLGIGPDRLDPGVTVEMVSGDHYRVVVPPWEREYDSKALSYNLDNKSNACEKIDPSEVVRRVE